MNETKALEDFLDLVRDNFLGKTLIKISLGKAVQKNAELKNVYISPVALGQGEKLSFVYRHQSKDITKNFEIAEGIEQIRELIDQHFLQANFFAQKKDAQLMKSKKGKLILKTSPASSPLLQSFSHDKIKRRLIQPEGKLYLHQLGITTEDFVVMPKMNSKFRQINKFVEIIDSILPEVLPADKDFRVTDMGSGKGYLTFALYDHLKNNREVQAEISGVELREELVNQCNTIARDNGFDKLSFVKNSIQDHKLENIDMLIALHACDTATDDAIFKGIRANASYIVVAPCCHKQVRKAMNPGKLLKPILKHGIYFERQAELLTDGIRGLILEKHGYQVKTLEFVSSEHTPKNVMIVATKTSKKINTDRIAQEIVQLKTTFGIENHYLESLLATY